MALGQMRLRGGGVFDLIQAEQGCAAFDDRTLCDEQVIKALGIFGQPGACLVRPHRVGQRLCPDGKGGAGHGPRAKRLCQIGDNRRIANGKAKAQTRKAPEFAKAFQHNGAGPRGQADQRRLWHDIAKAFVDDAQVRGDLIRLPHHAVRVVRVHRDDGIAGIIHQCPTRSAKGCAVFVIGRAGDRDLTRFAKARQLGNRGRGTGDRQHGRCVRDIPEGAGALDQFGLRGLIGQCVPRMGGKVGQRIGDGVNARRQVKPIGAGAAVFRNSRVQTAAVIARRLHAASESDAASGRGGWRVTKWPLIACGQSRYGTCPFLDPACRAA